MRVGSSWAYVCLPGDLASRQIAGHSVGVGHDADLVLAAFAALRFPLDEIEVFHTVFCFNVCSTGSAVFFRSVG